MQGAASVNYKKLFVTAAGAVIVLLTVAWFLRNSLIERLSNPLLAEYGLTLTHVSLDAMSSDNATISYLELVHEKGTTIAIDDLSLPLSGSASRLRKLSAGKISIISATRDENEPIEPARLIDQFLSLPSVLGNIDVSVGQLVVPPYPALRELRVVLNQDEQRIGATVEAMAISVTATPADDGGRTLALALRQELPSAQPLSVSAGMRQDEKGIARSGLSVLDLPAWQPLARFAGIVPQEIDIESGTADMQFMLDIPYDTGQAPRATVTLAPASPLQFVYTDESGVPTLVKVLSGSVVQATAIFSDADWSLSQQNSSLLVSYEDWTEIPVKISDLTCNNTGPQCSMKSSITSSSLCPSSCP